MLKPLSILLMAAIAAPVTAQTNATAQPGAPAVSKDKDPNRIICEREETIGSRLAGKKVCMTAAQWQEQQARHREQVEKFQQQNTSTGVPSGGI
jgi:invasion protein IalB